MSDIDRSITNSQVIPFFETDLFKGHEESRFAIGIIAVGDDIVPGRENEFDAYLRLRARVYADQTRMIEPEQVRPDGTEMDEDDGRSVHFSIYEQDELGARAVGAMRLIIKSEEDDRPLPIEDFFPEAFQDGEAPVGSTEASRYIARHERAGVQGVLSQTILTGALSYIVAHRLGPTFGTVEPSIERDFVRKGVPFKRIADPRFVPEYAADNLGLQIDTDGFAAVVEERQPGVLDAFHRHEDQFTYFGRNQALAGPPPVAAELVRVA